MKSIKLLLLTATVASFVACNKTEETDNGGWSNVDKIEIANVPTDTLTIMAGQTFPLEVVTSPVGARVNCYVSGGINMGTRVISVEEPSHVVVAQAGGQARIVATGPNGKGGYTEKLIVVKVLENAEKLGTDDGDPNKKVRFILGQTNRDLNLLTDPSFFKIYPVTANNIQKMEFTHTDATNFTINQTTGVLRYTGSTSITLNNANKHVDTVRLTVTNNDGSVVSKEYVFRNAIYLNIVYCCSSYSGTAPRFEPAGLFDSRTYVTYNSYVGGWHSSEANTGKHAGEETGHPHYILVDFKEKVKLNGVELGRHSGDTKDVEFYYVSDPDKVLTLGTTTANYPAWKDTDGTYAWQYWGAVSFDNAAPSPAYNQQVFLASSTLETRYLMLKVAKGNRGNSMNLMEIFPYIVP
ncbi:hypothetical protein FACS1894159_03010 [Bacteroidia bacterium]|nr:hypothetical protein FACS1894159_03010 [Bacteroidia bacterium]